MTQSNSSDWFETWFDTPLYEKLYAYRDMEEALQLSELISSHFPSTKFPHAIDIACGRGRHTFNLAQLGYSVMGIDLSTNAIQKAREISQNFPEQHKVTFKEHDLRKPIPGQYDLAVNLFTSFGYMEDDELNRLTLSHIASCMKSGAGIVMDYLNPGFVRSTLVSSEIQKHSGYEVSIKRFIRDGSVQKKMMFTHIETAKQQSFNERVKLYSLEWFREEFKNNGIILTDTKGDYSGAEYHPSESPRMIMFGNKS